MSPIPEILQDSVEEIDFLTSNPIFPTNYATLLIFTSYTLEQRLNPACHLFIKFYWNTATPFIDYSLYLLLCYNVRVEYLKQKQSGPQTLKYLISDPLWKNLLTPAIENNLITKC